VMISSNDLERERRFSVSEVIEQRDALTLKRRYRSRSLELIITTVMST